MPGREVGAATDTREATPVVTGTARALARVMMNTLLRLALIASLGCLTGCFAHGPHGPGARSSGGDHDRGHGNDADGHDEDNPGRGRGRGRGRGHGRGH